MKAIPLLRTSIILNVFFCLFCFCSCKDDQGNNSYSSGGLEDHFSIGEKHIIHSDILDEDREIWISVPESFYGMNETGVEYPVVYVLDGENLFLPTVGIVRQLSAPFSANDLSPQMIVVGIPNVDRNRDFTPTKAMIFRDPSTLEVTGGADKFTAFIEKELFPFIDAKYKTASHKTLIGHSLGGLFVMNTLIHHSNLFNNYLAVDAATNWEDGEFREDILQHFKNDQFQNRSLFMATANNKYPWMTLDEVRKDTTLMMEMMNSLLLLEDGLDGVELNGLSLEIKYYENENHFQVAIPAIYDGLRFLFDGYSFADMANYYSPDNPKKDSDLLPELQNHFKQLGDKMGYVVKPAESYINAWAFGFVQMEKFQVAEDLLDLNITNYPKSTHVYEAKGEFFVMTGDTIKAIDLLEQALTTRSSNAIKDRIRSLKE